MNGYKYFFFHFKAKNRKYGFFKWIVIDQNSLPSDVVLSPNVNSFKCKLDDHWKQYKFEDLENFSFVMTWFKTQVVMLFFQPNSLSLSL